MLETYLTQNVSKKSMLENETYCYYSGKMLEKTWPFHSLTWNANKIYPPTVEKKIFTEKERFYMLAGYLMNSIVFYDFQEGSAPTIF